MAVRTTLKGLAQDSDMLGCHTLQQDHLTFHIAHAVCRTIQWLEPSVAWHQLEPLSASSKLLSSLPPHPPTIC
jgi:hypothetical protein